ncbi:MAG: ferrochelatase [Candidatus Dormibacteria bacterium]
MTSSAATPTPPGAGTAVRAVLLMAYGSPQDRDQILPYYTHMRGGRAPSAAAVAELESRYEAIGGYSPLADITRAQAAGLSQVLRDQGGPPWEVVVGMKHTAPFIEDAVRQIAALGIERAVGVVLAPHYSVMSIAGYVERALAAARETGGTLQLSFVEDWHLEPGYISWLAGQVQGRLLELGQDASRPPLVIFTAHSLPARLREMGDPYPNQLGETAAAVANQLGLANWTTGWQSVARSAGEPWLGPELLEVVRQAAEAGTTEFVVCACGFVADHLEILFDLDVAAQDEASRLGITIVRTAMPNADPDFIRVLADLARQGIADLS